MTNAGPEVLCETDGGVAHVVLNRGPERRNAWNQALAEHLLTSLRDNAADPDVRCVVLRRRRRRILQRRLGISP